MDKPFRDQSVLIIGASLGIGRTLALQLAAQGAQLVLASRNLQKLEEVKTLCSERGSSVQVIPTDVTDRQACQNLVKGALDACSRLDMLVYSAGIGMRFNFEETQDVNILEQVMQVNFWGFVYCMHEALPYLKNTRGRVVALSSLGGKFPTPHGTMYAASKHAMAGFCDTLRIELKDSGVSITVVYPEWVETGISSRAVDKIGNPVGTMISQERGSMSVEKCAAKILQAAAVRKREVIWLHGRLGMWLYLISPPAVDQVAIHTFS